MSLYEQMKNGYAAYSARDFGFVDELFAADVRWNVPGPQGEITGREAVHAFFAGLTEQFASHRIEPVAALEDGARLWCRVRHVFTTKDGSVHEVAAVHMWQFAGAQVVSMDEVADTLAFGVAAGMIPAEVLAAA